MVCDWKICQGAQKLEMVKNYKRKTTKGQPYNRNDLLQAVAKVESSRCNAYRENQTFKIPLNTIIDHIKRRAKSNSYGQSRALRTGIEIKIVEGIRCMERYGFALFRKDVMLLIGDYVDKNKLKASFEDGQPKKDWLTLFMRRHKLSVKKPIQKGVLKVRIFPFDEKVILQHLFNPSALKRWKESQIELASHTPQIAAPDDLPAVFSTSERTFEPLRFSWPELLLRAVKNHSFGEKKKKMRIATVSEVITVDENFHRVQTIQNEKKIAENRRIKEKD
ncbi:hypothetical protein ILUMI_13725 [Ignelater luminosus]|uniref:Uncharacterized protein n=1 Tax=Ignelater luminosus TaxID=2038154 RepID=A0A8K0CRS0_IGNLU|nr:hypothetical protein ILUMI_13725 [Ignelater luminosus]